MNASPTRTLGLFGPCLPLPMLGRRRTDHLVKGNEKLLTPGNWELPTLGDGSEQFRRCPGQPAWLARAARSERRVAGAAARRSCRPPMACTRNSAKHQPQHPTPLRAKLMGCTVRSGAQTSVAKPKLTQIPASIPIGRKGTAAVVVEVDDPHGKLELSSGGIRWTPRGPGGRLRKQAAVRRTWKALIDRIET